MSELSSLADAVLRGERISRETALGLLGSPDDDLWDLLWAAFRSARRASAGGSSSACCRTRAAVSARRTATTARSPRSRRRTSRAIGSSPSTSCSPPRAAPSQRRAALLHGDQRARPERRRTSRASRARRGASSAELPGARALRRRSASWRRSRRARCKAAGVDFVNHNLNTSERFHPRDLHHARPTTTACARVRQRATRRALDLLRRDHRHGRDRRGRRRPRASRCASSRSTRCRSTSCIPIDGTRRSSGRASLRRSGPALPARSALFRLTNPARRDPRRRRPRAQPRAWFSRSRSIAANSIFVDGLPDHAGAGHDEARAWSRRWASRWKRVSKRPEKRPPASRGQLRPATVIFPTLSVGAETVERNSRSLATMSMSRASRSSCRRS